MTLALLIIGIVLFVAAIRNSQGALFSALKTDVPGFVLWAAAIVAIGMVGYVKGLKPVSVALLVLVFVVLILNGSTLNNIIAGFQSADTTNTNAGATSSGSSSTSSVAPGSTSVIPSIVGNPSSAQSAIGGADNIIY
jgi:hypothetical protein